MKRGLACILFAAGCSVLAGDATRIIALELVGPSAYDVTAGDTVHLRARALAANGDTVSGAMVTWAVMDTGVVGIVLVDSTGTVAARLAGRWHLQARVQDIRSDSIAIAVASGPAVSLALAGIADPAAAGAATTDTVTARDAFGNVATGYTGTVHFVSSDTAATLPADYAFTAADAGVHVFVSGVTFATLGTQTVTVADVADGGLAATRLTTVTAP